jgi:hypothetical protein
LSGPDSSPSGPSLLRNNRMPYYCNTGVGRPDSVLATAEDGLLVIAAGNPPQPISTATPAV